MIEHLDLKLRLLLLATPVCLILIGLASDVHIACSRQYKEMTSALQRSACLPFATAMWGEKKIGSRVLVISVIAGAIGSPTSSIRRGLMDERDYRQFPKKLKSKILISSSLNNIGIIWIAVNFFI
ncbi:hypothetical protein N5K35_21170 [Pseudomonas sp. GD03651]|jgi:hypothetical protein|uniref:hypothetical protein n=1 Tax=Pseudomonas TaxID=286 RepID=UPI000465E494|nr:MULTISPECIES: hypothetical protein [Pseudomonas]EKT4453732.1 hypothetical protein [Pseudomonas putida]MCE0780316.1 hypothetical protein [Pseudomonas sp. NMI542_15]MDD2067518.1 hypothetical protein [Pseudomonas putida]MDH2186198.1 hypothetical protein [Pseudomonas sp. GD03651]HDS1743661.1 hypothetical protein [Pseudomonas putida]